MSRARARTRLRNAALAVALAVGAVTVAAAPSYAIDALTIRELIRIQQLPNPGDIVDPGDLPSCDTPTVSYCIEVGDAVLGPLALPNVDYDADHVTDVVAILKRYEVGIGSVGTNQFTCVTLLQPVASDPCALLGIEPYLEVPLVAQPIDVLTPYVDDEPLTTVTVCAAEMVVNGGALRLPTFAVC